MNFKGAAKRLDDIDLPKLGKVLGVGEDELHAFIDVETRGTGFDPQGRPRILFERHKFHKYVPAGRRAEALKSGLANKDAGGYGKESEQYDKLDRAIKIDRKAALYSCSWGLGQIMGFNHVLAGYADVEDMVKAFMADEENHLAAAVAFIKTNKLDGALRRRDWAAFARGYNGSDYARNSYDKKLAEAFAKWQRIKDTPLPPQKLPASVAADLPAAPAKDAEIVVVHGPAAGETSVVTVQNPVSEPAKPQLPTKPTGIMVLFGLIAAAATAAWNYFGG